jgi:hypothetical protein
MTAIVDLAALPPVVVVPGLARWLGIPEPADEPDDSYEAFLDRISQEPAR